jgi:hypothetical protein
MMADESAPLQPDTVARLLRTSLSMLTSELAALPGELLTWHPAPGEWCIKEVVGHMIETERRGFAGRIQLILESPNPAIEPWDPDAVARERRDHDKEIGVLLEEFRAMREAGIALVLRLGDADLRRGATHPQIGDLRVVDLLHEWVYHDGDHLKQILTVVQDFAWPHLGATQRFYQP